MRGFCSKQMRAQKEAPHRLESQAADEGHIGRIRPSLFSISAGLLALSTGWEEERSSSHREDGASSPA